VDTEKRPTFEALLASIQKEYGKVAKDLGLPVDDNADRKMSIYAGYEEFYAGGSVYNNISQLA